MPEANEPPPAGRFERLNREVVECRRCPRLVAWRERVAREKRAAFRDHDYWGRPVPGFGDPGARFALEPGGVARPRPAHARLEEPGGVGRLS